MGSAIFAAFSSPRGQSIELPCTQLRVIMLCIASLMGAGGDAGLDR